MNNHNVSRKRIIAQAVNLSKQYSGVEVVHKVSFDIHAGEVLGLVGENGAGKSTLVAMFSGAVAPNGGQIAFEDVTYQRMNPMLSNQLGIGAIRQEPVLVPSLSVMENMLIGREPRRYGLVNRRQSQAIAQEWLEMASADISPTALICDLLPADRQFVEIARVVGGGKKLVFFDEPTAVFGPSETQRLFDLIGRLAAQGVAVVYVSHRLAEIFEICQRVIVLRDGYLTADNSIEDLNEDKLVSLIAGRELATDFSQRKTRKQLQGEPIMVLEGISSNQRLRDISFDIRPGETLGLFGIVGSGRSRLARLISGMEPITSGKMTINGESYLPRSPIDALNSGIVLVPEDRHRSALFKDMSLATNALMGSHWKYAKAGCLTAGQEAKASLPLLRRLDVRPLEPRRLAGTLSGGNQQKLVLCRCLARGPRILVMDEPTRGVDVGAKVDIHDFIREQTRKGVAVIVVSSDLRELMTLSDKITVLSRGRMVGTFEGQFDPEEIIAAATAVRRPSSTERKRHELWNQN